MARPSKIARESEKRRWRQSVKLWWRKMGCLCSKLYDKSRSFHLKRWSNNKFEKYRLRDEGSPKSEFTAIAPAHNSVARQNAASSRVSKPADKPAAAVKKKEEEDVFLGQEAPAGSERFYVHEHRGGGGVQAGGPNQRAAVRD